MRTASKIVPDAVILKPYRSFLVELLQELESGISREGSTTFKMASKLEYHSIRLHSIDSDMLLLVGCAALGALIKNLKIMHSVAASDVFATGLF